MFCINCGTQNLEEANFCYKCGFKLKEAIKIIPQTPTVIAPENIEKQSKLKVKKNLKIKAPKIKIKISWKGWIAIILAILLGLFILLIANSKPPSKTKNKKIKKISQLKSNELKVGDSAETRIYIVTVNSVKKVDTINEKNDPLLIAKAKPEEIFIIVNLSIKNKTKETKVWSSLIDKPKIIANGGYEYFEDSTLRSYIKNPIEDGTILSDSTKTGSMVFRIKSNLNNLKFVFSTFDKTIKWSLEIK